MKKIAILILTLFISSTALLFAGCSDGLKPINMSVYYNTNVDSIVYTNDISSNRTLDLSTVTASSADWSKMDKYYDFNFSANASWIYKMYIERIEFYVLCNETTNEEMSINLKITNLAPEDNLSNISTHTDMKSHHPTENVAQKYTFDINKVVVTATGSKITLDIDQSTSLISIKNNPNNNFKWIIYGFKIYGESREYSK